MSKTSPLPPSLPPSLPPALPPSLPQALPPSPHGVVDREDDCHSAVQVGVVQLLVVSAWVKDSQEDGVLTPRDGIDTAPHLEGGREGGKEGGREGGREGERKEVQCRKH